MTTGKQMRVVSPKKLPAGKGWGVLAGADAQPGETVQVVTRRGKTWIAELVEEVTYGVWSTDTTEAAPGATRDRLERRADQREDWGDSRSRKASQAFDEASLSEEKTGIPFGQPILVGHHSERRHRRTIERATRKGFEGLEHSKQAEKHYQKADGIRHQLDRSIYDDDPDAIERLEAKLADLEAQRERVKLINKTLRKKQPLGPLQLTEKEKTDLKCSATFHGRVGYAPYMLQNLGSNIRRTRERIKNLRRFET